MHPAPNIRLGPLGGRAIALVLLRISSREARIFATRSSPTSCPAGYLSAGCLAASPAARLYSARVAGSCECEHDDDLLIRAVPTASNPAGCLSAIYRAAALAAWFPRVGAPRKYGCFAAGSLTSRCFGLRPRLTCAVHGVAPFGLPAAVYPEPSQAPVFASAGVRGRHLPLGRPRPPALRATCRQAVSRLPPPPGCTVQELLGHADVKARVPSGAHARKVQSKGVRAGLRMVQKAGGTPTLLCRGVFALFGVAPSPQGVPGNNVPSRAKMELSTP